MKHFLLSFLALSISLYSHSQIEKFGKIKDYEWGITNCSYDSEQNIVILFDDGLFSYYFYENEDKERKLKKEYLHLVHSRHIRYKLLKSIDDKVSLLKIPIKQVDNEFTLKNFNGLICSKNKKKTSKEKIKRQELIPFIDEQGNEFLVYELKDCTKGSIIEFSYSLEIGVDTQILSWSFIGKYPLYHSRVEFKIPDFISYTEESNLPNNVRIESYSKSKEHFMHSPSEGHGHYGGIRKYYYTDNCVTYSLDSIPSYTSTNEISSKTYLINGINTNSVYWGY